MLPPDVKLESANTPLDVRGIQILPISHKERTVHENVYFAANIKSALLGRDALTALGLVAHINAASVTEKLPEKKFSCLFEGLGTILGKSSILLEEDAVPYAVPAPHRVALPLLSTLKKKLDQMQSSAVITVQSQSQPTGQHQSL